MPAVPEPKGTHFLPFLPGTPLKDMKRRSCNGYAGCGEDALSFEHGVRDDRFAYASTTLHAGATFIPDDDRPDVLYNWLYGLLSLL
jgi:hypothetical protein